MAMSEKKRDIIEMLAASVLLGAALTTAAYAQRDPAYQSARSEGLIGEMPNGYLGFVTPPSAAIKALVDDLNIKRKAKYTQEAQATGATVEEFALRNGCRLITERTASGEKYKAPDQTWKTRDANPPILDPRCPV